MIKQFIKANRGNTLVEFALILPIMVLIFSGIFEISMYALLNNKLVRIAGTMSHVVSMQNVSRAKLLAIMGTAEKIAEPFTFAGKGGVIVSQIRNNGETTNPANMTISWQDSIGGYNSKIGTAGGSPSDLPGDVDVIEDQALIITEVFYDYTPFIFKGIINNVQIYKTAVYVPRIGSMSTLIGEEQ